MKGLMGGGRGASWRVCGRNSQERVVTLKRGFRGKKWDITKIALRMKKALRPKPKKKKREKNATCRTKKKQTIRDVKVQRPRKHGR